MAILHHGILGGFSGKVGNIVGYRYKNHYCIRQMPRKSIKSAGNKQLSQVISLNPLLWIGPLRT